MIKKRYPIIMVFFVLVFASNCTGEPLTPQACKAKVEAAAVMQLLLL